MSGEIIIVQDSDDGTEKDNRLSIENATFCGLQNAAVERFQGAMSSESKCDDIESESGSRIETQEMEEESGTTAIEGDMKVAEGNSIATSAAQMVSTRAKTRKPQTEDEFQSQLEQFRKSGPKLNTSEWLYEDLHLLDNNMKIDRVKMLHAVEKAYYMRDYDKCKELIEVAEKVFEIVDENQAKEEWDQSGKKIKKSAKLERHVIDLLHIKEKVYDRQTSEAS
ncbi:uncharacterized protein RJT20DRAFT_126735 [Scheffersomyces xylosifermentans]|uniref:uncharacterized protein n=1 Tax=Scheffersomyces xylosifermentans TaxID=1304137 RepID=UPI00315C5084